MAHFKGILQAISVKSFCTLFPLKFIHFYCKFYLMEVDRNWFNSEFYI